jgi:hypothetical protein
MIVPGNQNRRRSFLQSPALQAMIVIVTMITAVILAWWIF